MRGWLLLRRTAAPFLPNCPANNRTFIEPDQRSSPAHGRTTMSEDFKRYDLDEIRKAVAILFADVKFGAGECVEVRMIDKRKHLVAAGWFDGTEVMAKAVARLARDGFGEAGSYRHIHENVYWTCNPVNDALLARQQRTRLI